MKYLFSLIIFLSLTSSVYAQDKNAFTREKAIEYLDQKINNQTEFNLGDWLIGHTEKYKESHGPVSIAASDTYIFTVAKSTTFLVKGYKCANIEAIYNNRKLKVINELQAIICSSGTVVILKTKIYIKGENI